MALHWHNYDKGMEQLRQHNDTVDTIAVFQSNEII